MSFELFERAAELDTAELHVYRDPARDLQALIAIHSTRRGPALGGARCLPYASSEAALDDVLRLARGMSYKAALAELPMGGGKAVILAPRAPADRRSLFEAFGDAVDTLGGRYVTAKDSGTTVTDMDVIAERTRYVTSTSPERGGPGDPSPATAIGVRSALQAGLRRALGRDDLAGVRVAIQGCGGVGYHLADELHGRGAELIVADTDPDRAELCARAFGASVVPAEAILEQPCEVLAPCALGGVLDSDSVERLRCAVVCGGANNQLAGPRQGQRLHERGILYVPDYAANAGGVIEIMLHYEGFGRSAIRERLERVYETVLEVADHAAAEGITTAEAADRLAAARLEG